VIPLEEARARVLAGCRRLRPVTLPVAEALGLVLDETIVAGEAIPPFPNTAMDGFAVRSADTVDAPRRLDIVGTLAAGAAPDVEVGAGQAVRIMTGAPMPPGADAVIMVELTRASDDGSTVEVQATVPAGNHVRAAGEDVSPGQLVFGAGIELGPGHLGVLCSLGVTDVTVVPRPRVGVMSTGDELVEGAARLQPGQIRDSNRRTLLSLVERAGATPVDIGLIRDDEDAIRSAIDTAVETCDALITSGGVSMGDFDYVKKVLSATGDMAWMQVAIRPAKPLAFGLVADTPVFGLPGNPVSSMVSFELFARPGLRQMMGHAAVVRSPVVGIADTDLLRRSDGKTHFARVVVTYHDGAFHFSSAGGQGSHQLFAMATADALAVLPDGDGVRAGEIAELVLVD
jgi:molybdenum cofactor synthesis domain-containing protein